MEDIYASLSRNLYKIEDQKVTFEISPDQITSGSFLATLNQVSEVVESGKVTFDNTKNGYILGVDKGVAKFYIGTPTAYFNFDGTNVTLSGTLTATTITGGTFQTSSGTGQRMVIESVNNTLTFYNSSNALVSQMGGGTNIGDALRIVNDSSTTDGVSVTSTVQGVGFQYTNDSNVTNNAIVISQQGTTNNSNPSIQITRAGAGEGIYINYDGTSHAILIDSASTASFAIDLIQNSSAAAISINHSNTSDDIVSLDITSASTSHTDVAIRISATANSSGEAFAFDITTSGVGNTYFFKSPNSGMINPNAIAGGAAQNKKIRVLIGSSVYYIPLYDG